MSKNDIRTLTDTHTKVLRVHGGEYKFYSSDPYVPVYLERSVEREWKTAMELSGRICNERNITKACRAQGHNSFTRCVDSLASFAGYKLVEREEPLNKYNRRYAPFGAEEDCEVGRPSVVLVSSDNSPFSFFWAWYRTTPKTLKEYRWNDATNKDEEVEFETQILDDKPFMVGGLIFHREYQLESSDDEPGLRGTWSIHT